MKINELDISQFLNVMDTNIHAVTASAIEHLEAMEKLLNEVEVPDWELYTLAAEGYKEPEWEDATYALVDATEQLSEHASEVQAAVESLGKSTSLEKLASKLAQLAERGSEMALDEEPFTVMRPFELCESGVAIMQEKVGKLKKALQAL